MIVIPCFNGQQYLEPLIDSIPPMEEVLIVDTGSDDISYLKKFKVKTACTKKPGFGVGAFIYAYNKYKRDEYMFIHDSMVFKKNLEDFRKNDVTAWLKFPFEHGLHEYKGILESEYGDIPDAPEHGIFGPIFYSKRGPLDKIRSIGYFNNYPESKQHLCAMERGIPLAFKRAGVEVNFIDEYDPERLDNLKDYEHFDKFRPNRT